MRTKAMQWLRSLAITCPKCKTGLLTLLPELKIEDTFGYEKTCMCGNVRATYSATHNGRTKTIVMGKEDFLAKRTEYKTYVRLV